MPKTMAPIRLKLFSCVRYDGALLFEVADATDARNDYIVIA